MIRQPLEVSNRNIICLHYWPGGSSSIYSVGHVALETFSGNYRNYKLKDPQGIEEGIYVSFFPGGRPSDLNTCFNQKFRCLLAYEPAGFIYSETMLQKKSSESYHMPILIKNSFSEIKIYGRNSGGWQTTLLKADAFLALRFPNTANDFTPTRENDITDLMYTEISLKKAHIVVGCQKYLSHFHSRTVDQRLIYGQPAPHQIFLYSLNVDAINAAFIEFYNSIAQWDIFNGFFANTESGKNQNCAGLIAYLLMKGGAENLMGPQPYASHSYNAGVLSGALVSTPISTVACNRFLGTNLPTIMDRIRQIRSIPDLINDIRTQLQITQNFPPSALGLSLSIVMVGVLAGLSLDVYYSSSSFVITPEVILLAFQKAAETEQARYELIGELFANVNNTRNNPGRCTIS